MIIRFFDPKNDFAFKKLFGTEENKDILIPFLNEMLSEHLDAPIIDVTFTKTIQDPEHPGHKTGIVDVICHDQKGHEYLVEMQTAHDRGYEKRAQFYASRAYQAQLKRGKDYNELKNVYFLAITDFPVFPHDRVKSSHNTLDLEDYANYLTGLNYTFVELSKFHKKSNELVTAFDKWCYFFKNAESTMPEDVALVTVGVPVIERAYQATSVMSWNEDEVAMYDKAEKDERDYASILATAEWKGREKGREEGTFQTKCDIAMALKVSAVPLELIMKATGLSEQEIERLNSSLPLT
jgi:predicted transposase/invertase (TIGR01784 family)